jgi:hypothetical protein
VDRLVLLPVVATRTGATVVLKSGEVLVIYQVQIGKIINLLGLTVLLVQIDSFKQWSVVSTEVQRGVVLVKAVQTEVFLVTLGQ